MRIAIFSLAYSPFVGGAELAVKEITDRLPGRDFFCLTHKFNRDWPPSERIGNVNVLRYGNANNYYGGFWQKFFYVFRAWRAAEKLHRRQPIDLIWAIMAAYGGMAALFFKLRHPEIPLLLTLQEGDSEAHILKRVGIFYPFWKLIFKKADQIQVISRYLADFARRHGARCPIEVIPNGVDLEKIPNARYSMPNIPIIITTSRLVHKNGIDILVRAIAELKKVNGHTSNVKCRIVGGGPDEAKLKRLAADLGVANQIEFLGHVEPDQIPFYLQQAAVFVRPSRSEGLGSSFLEAMASGLPIIGTPVGGIPDFLKNYNQNDANGLFVNVDDPQDLAEKLAMLLSNENLRKKLGQNGRNLVRENYSWDIIAKKMGYLFETL